MSLKRLHRTKNLDIFYSDTSSKQEIPYVKSGISAGFPSPADDFLEGSIDLNKELIKNPSATFYGRVRGDSMINAGLNDGDLIIIDRSLEPRDNKIAVCYIDGDFTVKRIKITDCAVYLVAENKKYKPIKVTADDEFTIWGIVITVIKSV